MPYLLAWVNSPGFELQRSCVSKNCVCYGRLLSLGSAGEREGGDEVENGDRVSADHETPGQASCGELPEGQGELCRKGSGCTLPGSYVCVIKC